MSFRKGKILNKLIIEDNMIASKEEREKNFYRIKEVGYYGQQLGDMGSWIYDILKDEVFLSSKVHKILGYSSWEVFIKQEDHYFNVHNEDIEKVKAITQGALEGKEYDIEYRIITSADEERYVREKTKIIHDENNRPIKMFGIIQDITGYKRLERQIYNIQRKFQVLVQESSDVFEIIHANGTIKYMSEASENVIGYKPEERIGKNIYQYYEGKELKKVKGMVDQVLSEPNKKVKNDICFKTKSGNNIYLEVIMYNLLYDPSIEGIAINFRDITKRIELENRLAYIAEHDELTGLPNHLYFNKELNNQCQKSKKAQVHFALMLLDIDGFKYINDALGFKLGDRLIIQIAKRLRRSIDSKKLICLFSGIQFAIIVDNMYDSIEDYDRFAREIINLFSQPFKVGIYEIDVTISMGISIFLGDGKDSDMLLRKASLALLRAKNEGKNRYKFYSSDVNIQSYKQFQIRNDMRKALLDKQFKVYYQPIVNLKTNEIIATEALIRWEHPDWGTIKPNEFIPLAEETGFILILGSWLFKEVCRDYKKWIDSGLLDIKVSVNFSSIQFLEKNFVDNIINTINDFGLDPHFLIMEITEGILLENTDKTIEDIQKLRSFGIQVAIDDFGTGYSSLSYLNSFDIDIIKMDGSFTKKIPIDKTSTILVNSIINMAKGLKIKLVAEEIENWEQLTYLKGINCHCGQGHIYSKAIPIEEFEKLLAKKKCTPVLDQSNENALKNRRKFFRINFHKLLEGNLTILKINGKEINVGNTKVLIRDIGPGGLCFISNLQLPVEKGIILQFTTLLLEDHIKVQGHPVWIEEMEEGLYEYGIKFTMDENERVDLIKTLNQVQINMKKDILFEEGSFIKGSPIAYFNSLYNG